MSNRFSLTSCIVQHESTYMTTSLERVGIWGFWQVQCDTNLPREKRDLCDWDSSVCQQDFLSSKSQSLCRTVCLDVNRAGARRSGGQNKQV